MYEHPIKLNRIFKVKLEFLFILTKILGVQDVLKSARSAPEEVKSN